MFSLIISTWHFSEVFPEIYPPPPHTHKKNPQCNPFLSSSLWAHVRYFCSAVPWVRTTVPLSDAWICGFDVSRARTYRQFWYNAVKALKSTIKTEDELSYHLRASNNAVKSKDGGVFMLPFWFFSNLHMLLSYCYYLYFWHRFNKETFLRDFGPQWHGSSMFMTHSSCFTTPQRCSTWTQIWWLWRPLSAVTSLTHVKSAGGDHSFVTWCLLLL